MGGRTQCLHFILFQSFIYKVTFLNFNISIESIVWKSITICRHFTSWLKKMTYTKTCTDISNIGKKELNFKTLWTSSWWVFLHSNLLYLIVCLDSLKCRDFLFSILFTLIVILSNEKNNNSEYIPAEIDCLFDTPISLQFKLI